VTATLVTFDFNSEVLEQLPGKITARALQILREPLAGPIKQVNFADAIYRITVDCRGKANASRLQRG
jgi:hypothetical protein